MRLPRETGLYYMPPAAGHRTAESRRVNIHYIAPPMIPGSSRNLLEQNKTEIEDFLRRRPDAVLLEDGAEIMSMASSQWRLTLTQEKLLLEVWDGARSILRRVEGIAYRDRGRLGLFIRKPLGRATAILEIREPDAPAEASRGDARSRVRLELAAYLKKHFSDWRIERISNRSDREHSFSAWYVRGLMRRGQSAWAFAALGEPESPAAADAALAYGLNWLDWLRETAGRHAVAGLKLFLPPSAIEITARRAERLNPESARVEMFEWPAPGPPAAVGLGEFGNVETRLPLHRGASQWIERHCDLLLNWFGNSLGGLDAVPDSAANALSFRVFGLEVARMEGQVAPKLYWGMEGGRRIYRQENQHELREFVDRVIARRSHRGNLADNLYRAQPERWLESLLLRDITKMDPNLRGANIYPQVPAVSGTDRGVVDILGISKEGRLAVIELKLHEDINLPFQGIDYWMRVNWLNERRQFHAAGYFQGVEISPAPPVLYLVSPAFRFHPTNERLIGYFHPSIDVIQVGLNQQWREAVKVLFKRNVRRV